MRSKAAKADRHSGETVVRVGMHGCKVPHVAPPVSVSSTGPSFAGAGARGGDDFHRNCKDQLLGEARGRTRGVQHRCEPNDPSIFRVCVIFCPQTCPRETYESERTTGGRVRMTRAEGSKTRVSPVLVGCFSAFYAHVPIHACERRRSSLSSWRKQFVRTH